MDGGCGVSGAFGDSPCRSPGGCREHDGGFVVGRVVYERSYDGGFPCARAAGEDGDGGVGDFYECVLLFFGERERESSLDDVECTFVDGWVCDLGVVEVV